MSQGLTRESYLKSEREFKLRDAAISSVKFPILDNEGRKELVIGLSLDEVINCIAISRAINPVGNVEQRAIRHALYSADRGDLRPLKVEFYSEGSDKYGLYDRKLTERNL